MSDDTRYDDYLSAAVSSQPHAGAPAKIAAISKMLDHVESTLKDDGYPPEVVESERRLAKQAADRLIARIEAEAGSSPEAKPAAEQGEAAGWRAPARLMRTVWAKRIAWAMLALIVYLTPLMMFVREGADHAVATDALGHDVAIELNIAVADFAKETVTFHVLPTAGALMQPDGRLSRDVTIRIDPGSGPVSHTFKAQTHLAPWTLPVYADSGDILDYPFDRYQLDIDIDGMADGAEVSVQASLNQVPHGLRAQLSNIKSERGDADIAISIRRSGTVVFLALLSTLSVLLVSIAACTVAWQVAFRGRKIEFSMMVWVAALLFVIPAVRNALPGSPPAGAFLDFLVFFWLQIAAVVAMSSLVATWVRRAG